MSHCKCVKKSNVGAKGGSQNGLILGETLSTHKVSNSRANYPLKEIINPNCKIIYV